MKSSTKQTSGTGNLREGDDWCKKNLIQKCEGNMQLKDRGAEGSIIKKLVKTI
jgi:hypothetical protein